MSGLVMKQQTDEKRSVGEMTSHAQVLMYVYWTPLIAREQFADPVRPL